MITPDPWLPPTISESSGLSRLASGSALCSEERLVAVIDTTAGATLVTKSATPGACFGLVACPNPIRLGERMAKTVKIALVRGDARILQKFMIVEKIG
jgi:hypothetical protein